jgi:hypothetical protein
MAEHRVRHRLGSSLGRIELVIYGLLAAALAIAALGALANSGKLLWDGLVHWKMANQTTRVLNELLTVLMVVEILNTVRISIRSHILVIEPFLVVGLIASIRRILVITLEAAALTKDGHWSSGEAGSVFRSSMIELGLLGTLVLVLVFAITLLRRYAPVPSESMDPDEPETDQPKT